MADTHTPTRKARRILAVAAALTAAALAVAGCGSGSSSSSSGGGSSASTAKGTLTVGLPVDDASYAPLYLAQDRGLFEKHGLKVKLVVFKGGAELAKAVSGGSVDVAVSALSEMLLATQQHQPLKAFYGGYNQTSFEWFGQKGITSVEQAKGKKWGVTKIGSSTDFLTRYLFKKHGINPETGATIVGVGPGPAQIAAIKAKQVDATSASSLTAYQLEAQGLPVLARQSDFAKEYPNHVAYAKTATLKQRHDDVEHFLQGQVDGINLAKKDVNAAAQAIAKHQKVKPGLALRAAKDNESGWYADGRLPSKADMDVFWQIGVLNEQWPRPLPESQWLDRQFMDSYAQWSGNGGAA